MSGHLCLKWNNHSSAFLKSISNIQIKERYCDATIACQGKYFPVHRIILSTCSDYFDEIFERMQCQHPYIVFKDIEPNEMELLLNYMYQGEVNVVQERLPTLIKAAEALKVKGLAVPDEIPSSRESSSGKKRPNLSNDNPQPKRRSEDKRRRRDSQDLNPQTEASEAEYPHGDIATNSSENVATLGSDHQLEDEPKFIKQEPLEACDYGDQTQTMHSEYADGTLPIEGSSLPPLPSDSQSVSKEENVFVNFPVTDDRSVYIKTEEPLSSAEPFEEQSSSWSDFATANVMQNLPAAEMSRQDDMSKMIRGEQESTSNIGFRIESEPCQEAEEDGTSFQKNSKPKGTTSRIHQCSYCEYESVWSSHVKRHVMSRHTGEKPFNCSLCTKRFTLKEQLQIHNRIHTGEKPFGCPYCSKKFSLKGNLKKHMVNKNWCFKL